MRDEHQSGAVAAGSLGGRAVAATERPDAVDPAAIDVYAPIAT